MSIVRAAALYRANEDGFGGKALVDRTQCCVHDGAHARTQALDLLYERCAADVQLARDSTDDAP